MGVYYDRYKLMNMMKMVTILILGIKFFAFESQYSHNQIDNNLRLLGLDN